MVLVSWNGLNKIFRKIEVANRDSDEDRTES